MLHTKVGQVVATWVEHGQASAHWLEPCEAEAEVEVERLRQRGRGAEAETENKVGQKRLLKILSATRRQSLST